MPDPITAIFCRRSGGEVKVIKLAQSSALVWSGSAYAPERPADQTDPRRGVARSTSNERMCSGSPTAPSRATAISKDTPGA
jgi:hypothetical protein